MLTGKPIPWVQWNSRRINSQHIVNQLRSVQVQIFCERRLGWGWGRHSPFGRIHLNLQLILILSPSAYKPKSSKEHPVTQEILKHTLCWKWNCKKAWILLDNKVAFYDCAYFPKQGEHASVTPVLVSKLLFFVSSHCISWYVVVSKKFGTLLLSHKQLAHLIYLSSNLCGTFSNIFFKKIFLKNYIYNVTLL